MSKPSVNIDELNAEERLDLLEKLWDRLTKEPSNLPLTEAQRRELDRRLDALDADLKRGEELGVPRDEVLEQIRARR